MAGAGNFASAQQTTTGVQADFSQLAARYRSGSINDTAYLNQCFRYTQSLLAKGVLCSDQEMMQYLGLFRKISWSNARYEPYKRKYYAILANQAQMANRGGAMLYYAEKLENIEKNGRYPSVAALTIKADFYRDRKAYDKVIKIYREQRARFASIPGAIEIETGNLVQAMMYLEKTNEAAAKLSDTNTAKEIYILMERIASVIKGRGSKDPIYNAYAAYCLARALNSGAVAGKNISLRKEAMAQLDTLLHTAEVPEALKVYVEQTFMEQKIEYYADLQHADSLSYWLSVYENHPNVGKDYNTRYYIKHKRSLEYLIKGDYITSLALLGEAVDLMEKSKVEMTGDIDGMLYAHAHAEEKSLELAESASMMKRQTALLIAVGTLSVCIILGLQWYFYHSRKVLRKRIKQLDDTIDQQVALLEEVKLVARREEQQHISRELHDEWSPGLVSVMHQVGFIAHDTVDENIKPALDKLYAQVSSTYESLRHFSHQLYQTAYGADDNLFENRIKTVVNQAFPDNHFEKKILISGGTMIYIDLNARIELLRIIQEAVINIIRHAAAKEVTVLLYEETGSITLTIADNGKGFDVQDRLALPHRKGMGLDSIKSRAAALNGILNIESGKMGTSVTVVFPVLSLYQQ